MRTLHKLMVVTAAASMLMLSACTSTPGPDPDNSSGGGSISDELAAKLEAIKAPAGDFVAPGDPIDISDAQGEEVWYVPIGASIPTLTILQAGLEEAGQAAGVTVRVCDGQFNPSNWADCMGQAANAGAAAVIIDSFPVEAVSTPAADLAAKGIPLLVLNQGTPQDNTELLAYSGADQTAMSVYASDWILGDSGAENAGVLYVALTDSPTLTNAIDAAAAELAAECSSCTSTITKSSTANQSTIPSNVSAALTANPGIGYVQAQVDSIAAQAIQGIQQAGFADKVKVVSVIGQLPQMRLVASGGQAADVAVDLNYEGWQAMDSALRLIAGETPEPTQPPYRLFDSSNIGEATLDEDSVASGQWFGTESWRDSIAELWTK